MVRTRRGKATSEDDLGSPIIRNQDDGVIVDPTNDAKKKYHAMKVRTLSGAAMGVAFVLMIYSGKYLICMLFMDSYFYLLRIVTDPRRTGWGGEPHPPPLPPFFLLAFSSHTFYASFIFTLQVMSLCGP